MIDEKLVRVNEYSKKIKELTFLNRISIDYPLLCRDSVAKKLAQVSNNLPPEYLLQVDSGYRSKETEFVLFANRKNIMPGLVSDPQLEKSSHRTGGAVDVTLTDSNGREINLSEPFTKYYQEPQLISDRITLEAQNKRNMLNKLMLEAGFAPHPNEYWHFSYGDTRWSEYTGNDTLYDEIKLDRSFYYSTLISLFFRILRKLNRIKNVIFKIETNV